VTLLDGLPVRLAGQMKGVVDAADARGLTISVAHLSRSPIISVQMLEHDAA